MKTLSIALISIFLSVPAFAGKAGENCTSQNHGDRNEVASKVDVETYAAKRLGNKNIKKKKRTQDARQ